MLLCDSRGLLDCGRRGCSSDRKRDTISQKRRLQRPIFISDARKLVALKAAFPRKLPYCTASWRIAEVLGAKLAPPTNVAVMLCVPTANVEVTNVT